MRKQKSTFALAALLAIGSLTLQNRAVGQQPESKGQGSLFSTDAEINRQSPPGDDNLKNNQTSPSLKEPTTSEPKDSSLRALEQKVDNQVSSINRASGLIGMEVKNAQNESLGKIQDIVFDFHTGKISYVVLSAGGFLGINDKSIAVPLDAFAAPRGEEHLVLNATRETLQSTTGFAKNSYPALNAPIWNPQTRPDRTARTDAAQVRSNTKGEIQSYSGTISSIDKQQNRLTIDGEGGKKQFSIEEIPVIRLKSNPKAGMDDLKEGTMVTVHYGESGRGLPKAQSITDFMDASAIGASNTKPESGTASDQSSGNVENKNKDSDSKTSNSPK